MSLGLHEASLWGKLQVAGCKTRDKPGVAKVLSIIVLGLDIASKISMYRNIQLSTLIFEDIELLIPMF